MQKVLLLSFTLLLLSACSDNPPRQDTQAQSSPEKENFIPQISYTVAGIGPHDTNAFTEGLFIHKGQLFESTGSPEELPGAKSLFGIVDVKTGRIDTKAEIDRNTYFGEGIVLLKDKIYQLTYKNQIGFMYDAKTFKQLGQFSYENKEGWGLTADSTHLIMSDGSNVLTYLDPNSLQPAKRINVTNNGYAEDYLNELEYIKGFIYANVWMKNYIVKINPRDGKIVGILDLSNLFYKAKEKYPNAQEMNGIAYDKDADKIYITGKLWPEIYEIQFEH